MTVQFKKIELYTWVRLNNCFQTVQIFKGDKKDSICHIDTAIEFCNKWNGYRENWERK